MQNRQIYIAQSEGSELAIIVVLAYGRMQGEANSTNRKKCTVFLTALVSWVVLLFSDSAYFPCGES